MGENWLNCIETEDIQNNDIKVEYVIQKTYKTFIYETEIQGNAFYHY